MSYQKIILIDDDADDQEIFICALEQASASVICTTFNDAREALEKLSSNEIVADLIFLDLNMPYMTGQQFISEIKGKEKLCHIPIIVLSTSSHPATKEITKKLGAADFITKPDSYNDFIQILKSVLH